MVWGVVDDLGRDPACVHALNRTASQIPPSNAVCLSRRGSVVEGWETGRKRASPSPPAGQPQCGVRPAENCRITSTVLE